MSPAENVTQSAIKALINAPDKESTVTHSQFQILPVLDQKTIAYIDIRFESGIKK